MQQDINKIKEAYEKTFEGSPLFGCWFEAKEDVWNFIEQNLKKAYKAGQDDKQLESIRMVSKEFLATLKDPNDDDAKFILDEVRKKAVKDVIKATKVKRLGNDNKGGDKLFIEGYNQAITRREDNEKNYVNKTT